MRKIKFERTVGFYMNRLIIVGAQKYSNGIEINKIIDLQLNGRVQILKSVSVSRSIMSKIRIKRKIRDAFDFN